MDESQTDFYNNLRLARRDARFLVNSLRRNGITITEDTPLSEILEYSKDTIYSDFPDQYNAIIEYWDSEREFISEKYGYDIGELDKYLKEGFFEDERR